MRQLLFVVLFLILLNITIVISAPPKCLTTENVYYDYKNPSITFNQDVDWWYHHTASQSFGAFYTDSTLSKKKKVIQLPLYNGRDETKYINPTYKTYLQAISQNGVPSPFSSLIYNEQIDTKVSDGAHSKGFFIWNNEGGIHVIHSNPHTPYNDYGHVGGFMRPSNNDHSQHAQHHFCKTISKADLVVIANYIILGDIRVVGINGEYQNLKRFSKNLGVKILGSDDDSTFKASVLKPLKNLPKLTFQDVIDFIKLKLVDNNGLLFHINKWVQIADIVANTKITSSPTLEWQYFSQIYNNNNQEFYYIQSTIGSFANGLRKKLFNKNDQSTYLDRKDKDSLLTKPKYRTGYNILYEYISQQADMNTYKWISQTETKIQKSTTGGNIMPYDRYGIKVVYHYSFEFNCVKDKTINDKVSSGHDHTKLFYGYKDANPDDSIMCIGDLNWQGKQELRGGGLFCSKKMSYLANYLRRHAYFFRATVTFGTEKRYYNYDLTPSSGSMFKFDFSDLKKELNTIKSMYNIQTIGDINFEIRTLFDPTTSTSQYIPLPGHRIIIMNKPLLIPEFTHTGVTFKTNSVGYNYNCGYENVNIPLLVNQYTQTNGDFNIDMEKYSFNVFTSNNIKLYMCPNDNQDCDYEDSEYVQLFTHSPSGKAKQINKENNYNWDNIKVGSSVYSVQLNAVKGDLMMKLRFFFGMSKMKSINTAYDKTIKVSKGITPIGGVDFNVADSLCYANSLDPNSIIIQHYDYCLDILFYCFKKINEFNKKGDDISTPSSFNSVYDTFKNKNKITWITKDCFNYYSTGSNPNTVAKAPKKK